MERTNQGGSVLSFVVVGVLLAGLLVGGIYFVNRQANSDTPARTPVTQEPQKPADQSTEQDKKQNPPPAEPGNKSQSGSTAELPATGPTELLGSLIVLGLLTGVAMSYLQSRRLQPSL